MTLNRAYQYFDGDNFIINEPYDIRVTVCSKQAAWTKLTYHCSILNTRIHGMKLCNREIDGYKTRVRPHYRMADFWYKETKHGAAAKKEYGSRKALIEELLDRGVLSEESPEFNSATNLPIKKFTDADIDNLISAHSFTVWNFRSGPAPLVLRAPSDTKGHTHVFRNICKYSECRARKMYLVNTQPINREEFLIAPGIYDDRELGWQYFKRGIKPGDYVFLSTSSYIYRRSFKCQWDWKLSLEDFEELPVEFDYPLRLKMVEYNKDHRFEFWNGQGVSEWRL